MSGDKNPLGKYEAPVTLWVVVLLLGTVTVLVGFGLVKVGQVMFG